MTEQRKSPRHAFKFDVQTGNSNKPRRLSTLANVIAAKKPVKIVLTADHVRRSIELDGCGNLATCAMSVSGCSQADGTFPHNVEGYIDWCYKTAYIVSKIDKTGMPIVCVKYAHNDSVAKLNDTKGGQQRLLALLERDGPMTIRLYPPNKREYSPQNDHRRDTNGTPRNVGTGKGKGAKARRAFASLGGL